MRNVWKIDHPDAPTKRSFMDSSLWEKRQLEGEDALKNLIRQGVQFTSAVCVLIGTYTWQRPWRYEIARAIIDNRGLVGCHLNNINHHVARGPHPLGENPLNYIAVGKVMENIYSTPKYYLFEKTAAGWVRYQKHTTPVSLPAYLSDPAADHVMPLSTAIPTYDFVRNDGATNLGSWINRAAIAVGR